MSIYRVGNPSVNCGTRYERASLANYFYWDVDIMFNTLDYVRIMIGMIGSLILFLIVTSIKVTKIEFIESVMTFTLLMPATCRINICGGMKL